MEATREPVTNNEFARAVGVHFTMASRYRNGQRIPSTKVLHRIAGVYDLPIDELVSAASAGGAQFGKYMRDTLFGHAPADLPQEVLSCPPL